MYTTRTCTRAHLQRTSSRGKARLRQKSADKSGELNGLRLPQQVCAAKTAGRLPRHAADSRGRQLPREDTLGEVGEEVSVRVSPVEFSY